MSNVSVSAQTATVSRAVADVGNIPVRGTRDGALFMADWKQALVMEGRAFMVNVGAFSTPIVGGGNGTVIAAQKPECLISVPSGTCILPYRIHIQLQAPLSVTDNDESETIIGIDRTQASDGTGTSTAETCLNLRTDNPRTSLCTATSAYTVNTTLPVMGIELAHSVTLADVQGTAATVNVTKHELLYEPVSAVPIIMGPACLLIHWGGTVATSGFAQVSWVELPSTMFT